MTDKELIAALVEQETRIEELEEALRKARGRFLGLSSAWHNDDSLQVELIAAAEAIPLPLEDYWVGYIKLVREGKEEAFIRAGYTTVSTDGD